MSAAPMSGEDASGAHSSGAHAAARPLDTWTRHALECLDLSPAIQPATVATALRLTPEDLATYRADPAGMPFGAVLFLAVFLRTNATATAAPDAATIIAAHLDAAAQDALEQSLARAVIEANARGESPQAVRWALRQCLAGLFGPELLDDAVRVEIERALAPLTTESATERPNDRGSDGGIG